jgi:NDP-sugar pyrophosphorylase family protein
MGSEFQRFWNYVDPNGVSSRIDITALFNPEAIGRLTIADTQADVLAAGSAKRLGARTEETSKGAIDMVGRPLSSFSMGKAALDGVPQFLIAALGYWNRKSLYEIYENGGGLSRMWGTPPVVIDYQSRESPYGSADCVRRNLQELAVDRPTFILQIDNVFGELDFKSLLGFSQEKNAFMTLTLTTVDDPSQYGTVKLDGSGRVTGMCEKSVLTLSVEDAARLNPYDAAGEIIKITPGIAQQLGLPKESVDYTHTMTHENARMIDYRSLVGQKVGLSRTQQQKLGYTKINCGLYYLAPGARVLLNSQECLDFFAREGSDIGGNLIGWLLAQKFPVFGYELDQHSKAQMGKVMWRDAGFPRELLETTADIVQGRVAYYEIPGRIEGTDIFIMPGNTDASRRSREDILTQVRVGDVRIDTSRGRVVIGEDVELASGVALEGPTYVGHHAKIGVKNPNVQNRIRISGSSIEPYSRVGAVDETKIPGKGRLGNNVLVRRSIIGEHTIVVGGESERATTQVTELEVEGGSGKTYLPSLIGGDCRISGGCRLEGVEISPHHTIETTHMIGAKFTSLRTPALPPMTPEQERLRRDVEFGTPDPSQIHMVRMRGYQRAAREFALALNEKDMLYSLGRADVEIHRAASIRQERLQTENDRHKKEMERLYQIVHSIEREKPNLDDEERSFAANALKRLAVAGSLNTGSANSVKTVQYLQAASKLLDRGERKSAEALLNKAVERAGSGDDQVAKALADGLRPQLIKEIEISTMVKEIERISLVPGDTESEKRIKQSLSDTTRAMVNAMKDGLLTSDKIIDLNAKLSRERKRLR